MYCSSCGQNNSPGTRFCGTCGQPVSQLAYGSEAVSVPASAGYPEYTEATLMYAGFWRRAFAFLIDNLILFPVHIVRVLADEMVGKDLSRPQAAEELMMASFISLAGYMVILLYFVLFESSKGQATPGKRILGIKVTDLNGNRITFLRGLGRQFSKLISGCTFLVGYLMAAYTSKKQALHDKIAKTLVVRR